MQTQAMAERRELPAPVVEPVPEDKKSFILTLVTIRCSECNKKLGELPAFTPFRIQCPRCKTMHVFGSDKKVVDRSIDPAAG